MPCYHPLKGWHQAGTKAITFKYNDSIGIPMSVPCGQCLGCRLKKSRTWALRCMHEAQSNQQNSFITLTYSPENLPKNNTLIKSDFQKFMKRLRKKTKQKIKYYHCGEYGETNLRPHYHAILFNKKFEDEKWIPGIPQNLKVSKELETTWDNGFSTIGSVTFNSAAYVSRYILKKQNGQYAQRKDPKTGIRPYERIDIDGVLQEEQVLPEYTTMSNGIGEEWFKKYGLQAYYNDFITLDGKKHPLPQYYDNLMYEIQPAYMAAIKEIRMEGFDPSEFTPERLAAKKKVAQARMSNYKRNL